jgi:anti-sigma factor RsiW
MTCREVIEFLLEYLSDELNAEQRVIFEAHLAVCPPCIRYIENYKHTMHMTRIVCRCAEDPVPDELVRAILAAREKPA